MSLSNIFGFQTILFAVRINWMIPWLFWFYSLLWLSVFYFQQKTGQLLVQLQTCSAFVPPAFSSLMALCRSKLAASMAELPRIWFSGHDCFSRMRSEGSRFMWGCGGEAVFAESCVCVRRRSQPFATVGNRLRERGKALHSAVWVICVAVVILAFAEELFLWVILVVAVILTFAEEMSVWVICVKSECLTRVSSKKCQVRVSSTSVLQERQVRVSYKSVRSQVSSNSVAQECQVRVSYKRVRQECQARVSSKSVLQECQVRVSSKSVVQECQVRSVKKECQVRVSYKSAK